MVDNKSSITPQLFTALHWAFTLFGHDARKGSNVPYLAHLLSVCAIVQQDGGSENEAIAALLHDTLEDKPKEISQEDIERTFGKEVLKLVELCTDTPKSFTGGEKPPWKVRKETYLARIKMTDPSLLRVTIADKIDNARAILADHHRIGKMVWKRFNAPKPDILWYYESCVKAFKTAQYEGPLFRELESLVKQMTEL